MPQWGVTNVYFLEADDHTAPAVSCEGKNTVLVALVTLKIKCYCCNLGREEKESIGYFFICRYGLLFQSLFIYSIYSVYVCATAMMKTILTPHFDLLNATRVEIYIVIKATVRFFWLCCFSVYLDNGRVLLQACWSSVKCGFCSSCLNCLSLIRAIWCNFQHLQNFCSSATAFDPEPFWMERVYWGRRGQDLSSGCFGVWEQQIGLVGNLDPPQRFFWTFLSSSS